MDQGGEQGRLCEPGKVGGSGRVGGPERVCAASQSSLPSEPSGS